MLIHSDWHIHSEYSYDAKNPTEQIAQRALEQGLCRVGITDHVNYNDASFLKDLQNSARGVRDIQTKHPFFVLGVELTPIERPQFDHLAAGGTRENYEPPLHERTPFGIELALTKPELQALGVRYAIGAAHWRVDSPFAKKLPPDLDACLREWYRQQMWLACDERVTILGHPWYHGRGIWYADFSVIPRGMNQDLAAALKENRKYVECNAHFFLTPSTTERFRRQYAEFLRELFEMEIGRAHV